MDVDNLLGALRGARLVDLSQTLEEHMPNYPTHSKFFHNLWGSYWHGGRSLTYQLVMNEHNGTHVDAPAHFISDAQPQAHITIERIPPARLVDCRGVPAGATVSHEFIAAWERAHGSLREGDIVLFNFGWSRNWGLRPNDNAYLENWPGVGMDAAQYLIDKSVAALGVDSLSPDSPEALKTNPIHPVVLEKQVLIVENLCHLEELPDFFLFVALPLKILGGSGSPIRAVAFF